MLHNLMVNLDTKDLIEHYTKSLRYCDVYSYIAHGQLPGNVNTQKKIVVEAANYIIVNGLLFKVMQHKESGKCTLCQRTKIKNTKQRPYYGCIPTDYIP